VMYQIFTDRFCNGDPTNDVETGEYHYLGGPSHKVADWNSVSKDASVRDFYGGDLQGVLDKLDYLQDLGVEVLYLNPIFVSPSNHKYDIQDYDHVDPHYGVIVHDDPRVLEEGDTDNRHAYRYIARVTDAENLERSNAFFAEFVEEIHKRGMKIILDGVFNHCGSFNKWLDREGIYEDAADFAPGAYQSADSPYRDYFEFKEDAWPNNASYEGWWNHATLPKLNYEKSPELCEEILRIAEKWVSSPYGIDGWRLDVGADLGHSLSFNHRFWKRFRKGVKEANPDAIILAEHYGDPADWLRGDEWDTVMNYDAFMEPVTWFLTGMEKHSDEFREDMLNNDVAFVETMRHNMLKFETGSLYAAMNELSNHDHSRFLTRTNRISGRTAILGPEMAGSGVNRAVMREAVLIQMTWPGAPTVYYGDEAGQVGWTDPDNRRTYPWGSEDWEMLGFHREMIRIHKNYPALRTGSLMLLTSEHGILCYARFNIDSVLIIAINNNPEEHAVTIPAWKCGITDAHKLVRIMKTDQAGYWPDAVIIFPENGTFTVRLAAESGVVFKNMANDEPDIAAE
ncbi:MAG: glycoside hydrolase family 13 protein, partial [Lachnospiraceae bacterium]|nr:glycoside hydrolase family 13 protein [Lachnospiraceae bacterium]